MATQLSYDVLKKIFEHLSVDKRFAIAKLCPTLSTAEKKSPLHLDSLHLKTFELHLNGQIFRRGHMLAGRGTVKVRKFSCEEMAIRKTFPDGLKLECQELQLNYLLQLINIEYIPSYLATPYPEKLTIFLNEDYDWLLEEELVKQTKLLVIGQKYDWTDESVEQLTKLRNGRIHVETQYVQFEPANVMKMAQSWLARCPDVGTRFTVEAEMYDYVLDVMDLLRENLGAVRGEVLEEKLRNSALRHCVTIEMRSGHELNVFGGRTIEKKKTRRWLLRMEVMRKGSTRVIL